MFKIILNKLSILYNIIKKFSNIFKYFTFFVKIVFPIYTSTQVSFGFIDSSDNHKSIFLCIIMASIWQLVKMGVKLWLIGPEASFQEELNSLSYLLGFGAVFAMPEICDFILDNFLTADHEIELKENSEKVELPEMDKEVELPETDKEV